MDILKQLKSYGLFRPRKLTFSITTHCNLRCEHCWVECDWTEKQVVYAPKKEILRLIKEFAELGGETLELTGGEPLSHNDFHEILNFSLGSKLEKVVLQTNATLINKEVLKSLPQANNHKLHFQVSLDGASEKTHDLVRGKGSFQAALAGLTALAKEGYGERTTIGFTEMYHNMHEIPNLLRLTTEMGIGSVIGWSLVDFGKAKHTDTLTPPLPEQYVDLLEYYHADKGFRDIYKKHGNFAAIEWFKGRDYPAGYSCELIEKPYLSAHGLFYPCVMLQEDEYAALNLFDRSLADAIREKLQVWGDLIKISVKRNESLACLESCPGAQHCAGGCFGRAKIFDDGERGCEDRCDLRRAVYHWHKSK